MTFSQTIGTWQSFYLLVGTAAATLIGLLFVAVSINIDAFRQRASRDLQHFAALTFNCFFYVLIFAIVFLVPDQSPLGLGLPLLVLGSLAFVNTVIQQRRTRKIQGGMGDVRLAQRFIVPSLCLFGLIVVAIALMLGDTLSLYGLVIIVILLLGSAAQNAWALLVLVDSKGK